MSPPPSDLPYLPYRLQAHVRRMLALERLRGLPAARGIWRSAHAMQSEYLPAGAKNNGGPIAAAEDPRAEGAESAAIAGIGSGSAGVVCNGVSDEGEGGSVCAGGGGGAVVGPAEEERRDDPYYGDDHTAERDGSPTSYRSHPHPLRMPELVARRRWRTQAFSTRALPWSAPSPQRAVRSGPPQLLTQPAGVVKGAPSGARELPWTVLKSLREAAPEPEGGRLFGGGAAAVSAASSDAGGEQEANKDLMGV